MKNTATTATTFPLYAVVHPTVANYAAAKLISTVALGGY